VQVQENMTSCYISVAQLLIDNAEVFTRGIAATRESFASFSDARSAKPRKRLASLVQRCCKSILGLLDKRKHLKYFANLAGAT
jgi:hypothetical protein